MSTNAAGRFDPLPSRWTAGQRVMARDPDSRRFRRATIERPSPMSHRGGGVTDGAYVCWADINRDAERDRIYGSPSSGGWNYEIVDGWDDGWAALESMAYALRCVGMWIAARNPECRP